MRKQVFPFFEPHIVKGGSKTIPNQSMQIRDIITKFASGTLIDDYYRPDELGEDVDEDIDTPFDAPRSGELGDFDRFSAHDYVGTIEDEIRHAQKEARHALDNDVLVDTKEKKSSEKVAEDENS